MDGQFCDDHEISRMLDEGNPNGHEDEGGCMVDNTNTMASKSATIETKEDFFDALVGKDGGYTQEEAEYLWNDGARKGMPRIAVELEAEMGNLRGMAQFGVLMAQSVQN